MIPNTSVSANRRYSLFTKPSSESSSHSAPQNDSDGTKSKQLPPKRSTNETGTLCQRCMVYEVNVTDTSDVLTATDAELSASRQVISLLQRQLELVRVEKEGLEKLIIAQQSPMPELVDNQHSNLLTDNEAGEAQPETENSNENKLLRLIRTQLYAKDEEIVKLNSRLKESENEIKQLKLQIHFVEEENAKLKTDNSVLAENVALRDQTIVSLSNEVFEQENLNDLHKPITRRQSMSSELVESQQSALKTQKHIAKLIDSLDAYKKTNELLSNNVMRLTERCNKTENKELEARSQCQELEAKCCQIQSKLLSLLKEIEQASQPSDSTSSTSTTADSPNLICSEPVKLLIKRLLEDKSLDIPLSWKEGNRSNHSKDIDDTKSSTVGKHDCDELGFYIIKDEKTEDQKSSPRSNKPPLRRAHTISERSSPSPNSSPFKLHTLDEAVEEFVSDNKKDISRQISVDSTKTDEAGWHLRWDEFIKNFDKIDLAKSKEFKDLLRSGVPQEYRCKVWKSLVDLRIGEVRKKHGCDFYQSLLESEKSASSNLRTLNPSSKQIELDLLRTLPNNKHFEMLDSPGTVRLRKVLTAYSNYNPTVGYCQGMNRLAAVALLVLPEEEAFWCLSAIVDKIMPQGYYNDLWLAQVDSSVVLDLVSIKMPRLSAHFKSNCIELSLFAWFLTIFVDGTSPALFLRLWDSFLYEGDKILFRIALALLHISGRQLLKLNSSVAVNNYIRVAANTLTDVDKFFEIAFEWMNPLSAKTIAAKRQHHFHLTKSALVFDDRIEKSSSKDGNRAEEDYESPAEDSSVISV